MIIRRNDEASKAREQVVERASRAQGKGLAFAAFACWMEQKKRDEEWMDGFQTCCKREFVRGLVDRTGQGGRKVKRSRGWRELMSCPGS